MKSHMGSPQSCSEPEDPEDAYQINMQKLAGLPCCCL